MQTLAKDGIVVLQQVLHQGLGATRIDDERREAQLFGKRRVALVILHLMAALQNLLFATAILEAMQVHLDASLNEGLHAIKHVDDPAVVGRIRHIETDDM